MAAAVILFAGLVTAGQTAMRAAFDTQETLAEGWSAHNTQGEDATLTVMTITSVSTVSGNTRIRADNNGATTIDGSDLSVIINGVDKTSLIITRKVATKTTDVWAPGQQIEVIVTGGGATRVILAASNGAMEAYP